MLTLLDYRVRQRDFLLEISRAITAQLDLSEVLRRVLDASIAMLGGQIGLIALRDPAGAAYRVRAVLGIGMEFVPELNEQIARLVDLVDAGSEFAVIDQHLRAMGAAIDPRLRQAFALPLTIADEPRGILIVFRTYRAAATPDDIQVLQSFADQAAIAVHNAQLYQSIDHERRRLAAILQHSADGVMILDPKLTILMVNRQLENMTAWPTADAVGQPMQAVIEWQRREGDDIAEALANGWPFTGSGTARDPAQETLYVEGEIVRKDGLTLSIGIRIAPLFNAEGQLANLIANVRDITNFRKAQEMQNVFISTISHELKTPVALIKGYAATLRREDVDWESALVREYAAVIEDEADRLTGLIENLLTASKIQAERRVQLNLSDVRLDEIAARSVERFSTQTSRHTFKLAFPQGYPAIVGDEVRLRQVIDNLVSNAIKYSPGGGVIEVGGFADEATVSLYVRDQGVGMTAAEQEHLFERFYRVDSALSRKTQGTGLGLYLSKAIVDAHGGSIRVSSQPGKGSTFTITLPQTPPA
jgi:signal transduction histidine kinase